MLAVFLLCLLSAHLVTSEDEEASPKPPPAPLECVTLGGTGKVCEATQTDCVAIMDWNTLTDKNSSLYYGCRNNEPCDRTFSFSIAKGKRLALSSACCKTANCNQDLVVPIPSASDMENGLICAEGCYSTSDADCKGVNISCTGDEIKCFNLTGKSDAKTIVAKGCGTQSVCQLKGTVLTIGGTPYNVSMVMCEEAESPVPNSSNQIHGKSSFLLSLPTIASVLFMKLLC
ncbi:phospholipase A2 inhibitor and Ly6/PLAUR domain-containing protein-like [Rhineura floridana]|uniref:phospholipase A2 inhibitor and Ly6/PLAUR domain-containing protein-like n=1 Tax=Rhineura floridana TaxID=261503 RepID=UPI002AC884EF|nr:phospholipase A2 inhibitor and Ly6/PLAUR domain-containing protein-like [Rhineura floridana]XP_061453427.1 phospholipase A2 inhibitor and Ly6/PLAUR domain-containing protein-like [Rhineura floridana]